MMPYLFIDRLHSNGGKIELDGTVKRIHKAVFEVRVETYLSYYTVARVSKGAETKIKCLKKYLTICILNQK